MREDEKGEEKTLLNRSAERQQLFHCMAAEGFLLQNYEFVSETCKVDSEFCFSNSLIW